MKTIVYLRNLLLTFRILFLKPALWLLSGLILIALGQCTIDDQLAFDDIPVVESYLTLNKPVSIQVTRKTPYEDNVKLSGDVIDALQIKIKYNGVERLIPSVGGGVFTDSKFFPVEGVNYNLEFNFNNQVVTSSTQIPSKPVNFQQSVSKITIPTMTFSGGRPTGGSFKMPDPVKLTWSNTAQDYYLLVTENAESSPVAIYEINDSTKIPGRIFRNEPTQASETEITSMNFQYFGKHRLILFHLNADYAALYKNTGTTSLNLTNPVTNIQNGLGIFTGINSDTLYLNVVKE
jgi:hypothetical protein